MKLNTTLLEAQELVLNDELDKAVEILYKTVNQNNSYNSDLSNKATSIIGQLREYKNDLIHGVTSFDQQKESRAKIRRNIILLISEIKKINSNEKPQQSEIKREDSFEHPMMKNSTYRTLTKLFGSTIPKQERKKPTGVPLNGIVYFKSGKTFEFDHIARFHDLSGSNFRFTDESILNATKREELPPGDSIEFKLIKKIKVENEISKEKEFYYEGSKKLVNKLCHWLQLTIEAKSGIIMEDAYVSTTLDWGAGSTISTSKIFVVNSGIKKGINLINIEKIEFS